MGIRQEKQLDKGIKKGGKKFEKELRKRCWTFWFIFHGR